MLILLNAMARLRQFEVRGVHFPLDGPSREFARHQLDWLPPQRPPRQLTD
jgi:hypothetical protein